MNTTEIMNDLSDLMGLQLREPPSIEINSKSAPRRLIGQLVRQRYIPSYQNAPDDLKRLVEGEGDCQPDTTIHIIDLLGVYDSKKNKIILFDLLIKLCSLQLDIDYDGLKKIVMMHELSHAITHRGIDSDEKIWEYFDEASPDSKEYFAQIYPYKKIQNDNNILLMSIMDTLSSTQSCNYQSYKTDIESPIEMINRELLEARRAIPSGFEVYLEAKSPQWEINFSNIHTIDKNRYVQYLMTGLHDLPPEEYIKEGIKFKITSEFLTFSGSQLRMSKVKLNKNTLIEVFNWINDCLPILEKHNALKYDVKIFPEFKVFYNGINYQFYFSNYLQSYSNTEFQNIIQIEYIPNIIQLDKFLKVVSNIDAKYDDDEDRYEDLRESEKEHFKYVINGAWS